MATSDGRQAVTLGNLGQIDANTDRVIANFESAVTSGNSQQIVVELAHLEQYYAQLYDVYDSLERLAAGTQRNVARAEHHVITLYAGKGPVPRIAGVDSAVETSIRIAARSGNGLTGALESVQAMLRKNLSDLYDSYGAYVRTDDVAADQLRAAGQSLQL